MTKYIPQGTRVLLYALPIEKRAIHLPEGARGPDAQKLRVEAIGQAVNDEKFHVEVGDIVQLINHPATMSGVDQGAMLLTVDRFDINVIVREGNE
jgi:hypothetical protein